ncbi:FAD/NAD(P)-binding oxidoreductase [Celeribacter baekdonensis]|uniref:Sulfide-quinone reductase n=1 Tax=Celeribacter baekdonensis TaxID=875171 RepID=A0A2R4M454_9RHOB|nr:FAD/NAD(P)-binding oxidoreductase [Celeribacter baekdonensis]AVW91961.1 pyridine nucleotide-disulfide oxidoreductase [Celeribacter baekdonensis]|tara:strand:- start:24388 stop:25659 length:1272 start_codon:yes stop_codon:yes gene_type:complete
MAHIVVLGAGLGGTIQAYELKETVGKDDKITVISNKSYFQFTPSNPWAGVGWRKKKDLIIELEPVMKKRGIDFICDGAKKLIPQENKIILDSGKEVTYDYLVLATGPDLAFDEIEGFGPEGFTHSVCHVEHAEVSGDGWDAFCANPGPIVVGAVQGASCFGPAYEYAMTIDTDLRRRKVRDQVPMTFVTPEPYIGHLGLGGVGDTKGMLESIMRERSIRWITNAKVNRFEEGKVFVTEHDEDGKPKKEHELPFSYSMLLPAFRGIPALMGVEGLVNPRGFVIVDDFQRNPTFPNIFGIGVCIAIAPKEPTVVPTGVPKTGFMIESMVTATAHNIPLVMAGKEPQKLATWNALCLADFGDGGAAFLAMPQNPPRNVNWAASGKWVHWAKLGFEWYFMRKVRKGVSEPFYERMVMKMLKVNKLKN